MYVCMYVCMCTVQFSQGEAVRDRHVRHLLQSSPCSTSALIRYVCMYECTYA